MTELLFEIGCEELPASYVEKALEALPGLAEQRLGALRLTHGQMRAIGTPRRLTLIVESLVAAQPNLEEVVTGPPVRVAFKDGAPTKAAEAFAKRLGVGVDALDRVETDKGAYLQGVLREEGKPTLALLPGMLAELVGAIPFRKSMRWGSGSVSFGRPLRWLMALFGEQIVPVEVEGYRAGRVTYGHRFLHPEAIEIRAPGDYVAALREARVLVEPEERRALMLERLHQAAKAAGGALVEDAFLVGENLSLVEDPQVVLGRFEEAFLALPEEVILEVARGHQRYFGLRRNDELMPHYLAVVNTAENPANIAKGNDRVMRARLADARFFYEEDLKKRLEERREALGGIVFQNKLGSVLDKVVRLEKLTAALARLAAASEAETASAVAAAGLCKCDLVTWMVGEFPELQGEVGRAYALVQGVAPEVAEAIAGHYRPKGAKDDVAGDPVSALVGLADRLDSLVGCFGIGLSPTGAADPFGLRRACIGILRTLLDRDLDLSVSALVKESASAHSVLELEGEALEEKLAGFIRDRLRGLLVAHSPPDAVDAALAVAADRPVDARRRARALASLEPDVRARLGEVFKRATNIAAQAAEGPAPALEDLRGGDEEAETALQEAYFAAASELTAARDEGRYGDAFARIADLAPLLARYFEEILVMADDDAVKRRRIGLMRHLSDTCAGLARLELLAVK